MKSRLVINIVTLIFLFSAKANSAVVIHYDIDFSSPTHTAGLAPTVGSASDTISDIRFGNPVVENFIGPSQALRFKGDSDSQVLIELGLGYDNYQISFDMYSSLSPDDTFRVFVDTPQIRNINFNPQPAAVVPSAPDWRIFNPSVFPATTFFSEAIPDGEYFSVSIGVDLLDNQWSVTVGQQQTFIQSLNSSSGDVANLRFSLDSGDFSNAFTGAAIDNILVTSTVVPAPSALLLFGSSLFLTRLARSKAKIL